MLSIPQIPMEHSPLAREAGMLFWDTCVVTLDGKPCRVRSCRESALPFNRVWPGVQRQCDQTELAGFVQFYSSEPVQVAVELESPCEKAVVRPLSRGIIPDVRSGRIEFLLKEPGQYVLENGSSHHPIYFFFEPQTEAPETTPATWHFGPGLHFPGVIKVSSGDSVYIDPAAIVFGCVYGNDVHDVRIFGGGTLHGGMEGRVFGSFCEDVQYSTLKFYNSSRIRISGIVVQDSPCWTTSFFGCSNVTMERVKILGQWRYNTDGIDICNSSHVTIADSFIRSFDDAVVLKGVGHLDLKLVKLPADSPVTDVLVRNCVLWCGWGRTLEVGIETGTPEFDRILFDECDLIHNSAVCMDIQNGNYADVHGIVFRNIRVEYQADTLPEIFQKSDEMTYDAAGRRGVPCLISVDNHRYGGQNGRFGDVHDILFENIQVFVEADGPEKLPVHFGNRSESARLGDITLRNISVNGRRLSGPEDAECRMEGHVERVCWE